MVLEHFNDAFEHAQDADSQDDQSEGDLLMEVLLTAEIADQPENQEEKDQGRDQ